MSVPRPAIVTCAGWGAKPARARAQVVGRPRRVIVHHTAGHHPEIAGPGNESVQEAIRYARDIQAFHMGPQRGWNDTGQSYLVCRNGVVLEGRHGTLAANARGLAVVSAHCPGQNDQPGIEHEHTHGESMTVEQRRASVRLMAWLCDRCGIRPTELYGHGHYYPTICPDTIDVAALRHLVALELNAHGRGRARRAPLYRLTQGRL